MNFSGKKYAFPTTEGAVFIYSTITWQLHATT
jgi:hypothetical protein